MNLQYLYKIAASDALEKSDSLNDFEKRALAGFRDHVESGKFLSDRQYLFLVKTYDKVFGEDSFKNLIKERCFKK